MKTRKKSKKSKAELLHDLKNCGKWAVYKCATCGTELRVVFMGCGHRVCAMCAREYSRVLSGRISERCREIMSRLRQGWSVKLLTLTIRKSGSLRDDVTLVLHSIGELWRKHLKYDDAGLIACLEIGPSLNVHAHCLYYGPYIPQKILSEHWKKLTGSQVVHITALKGKVEKAAREVTKYSSKMLHSDLDVLYDLYVALYGTRRVVEYGVFLGTAKSPDFEHCCPRCFDSELRLSRYILVSVEAEQLRREIRDLYG